MLARMRESMFSILQPWLPDAVVLDLFAGSGVLSLEALSRGARHARLVERDAATARLIGENVTGLELDERATVVTGDALTPSSWGAPDEARPDVVFFDPPYPLLTEPATRPRLFEVVRTLLTERTAEEAVLVFHAPVRALRATEFGPGLVVRERDLGSGALWFAQVDDESPVPA